MENETVFAKMADELEKAKNNQHDHDQLVKHISNIQLLCELFLGPTPEGATKQAESLQKPASESERYTEAEFKTMLGSVKPAAKPAEKDGMSIFDF
ncbi:DUF5327 family protein [Virgibacillus halophilus]|uniref:DUF5327 family protein n=1 Tax=Tigheibacillus halophilus TaxID=361280 RepID=A0ABU5C4L6_9BACI|nr:DUF5327 family protein [Virgibacillus halophilus]